MIPLLRRVLDTFYADAYYDTRLTDDIIKAIETLLMTENKAVTLNIGLHVDGVLTLKPDSIIHELQHLVTTGDVLLKTSDSEPTLIVEIARPLSTHELFYLAEQLNQGAIAQMVGDDGELVGPRASQWGPFDPAKFILTNGSRANACNS
jgi:hypothetical protein